MRAASKAGCRPLASSSVFGEIHRLLHQPHRRARHVDGHVAAADHHHALAQFDLEAQIDVDQKIDAVVDAGQVRAGNIQFAALVEPGGQQNRIELGAQIGEGDVAPQRDAGVQRNAHGQNVVHFHLDDFARQAELRNAQVEHSAGDRRGLEDLDRVAQQSQVVRAGEAADARADNGDPLAALDRRRQLLARRIVPHAQVMAIGGVALQRADGDGLVDLAAPAVVFAGMRADAAQHIGEGIGRAGQQIRFLILRDPDGLHIAPAFGMNRTGGAAGNILVEILLVRDRDGIAHGFPALVESVSYCNSKPQP